MGTEFKPSPKLKLIYWLYSLWYFVPMILAAIVILYFNLLAGIVFSLTLILVPLIVLAIWIPRFYNSIVFKLEEDHAYARYGVWWVKEKRVPYNLVSEARFRQGPLQRRLGLACIDVFTPATGTVRPELVYFQLDSGKANEVLSHLRRKTGILTARERRVIEEEILAELRSIRELLEHKL